MKSKLKELNHWIEKFQEGKLTPEEAEFAAEIARELYEDWVYIKYRKQKRNVHSDPVTRSFSEAFSTPRNEIKKARKVAEEKAAGWEKEETQEKPTAENQTTLIEIIREIQEDQSINDLIAKGKVKESLADKHLKKPIADLEKHIGINQKFSFINNLFDGDKEAYDEAIAFLNSCTGFLEADDYIQNRLRQKYNWDEETVSVIKFMDLVERRYIPVTK